MAASIGVLLPTPRDEPFLRAMQAELREVFGRGLPDLIFHVRTATKGDPDQMRDLIADLLQLAPTLLVTASSPAALAMARGTATTPIVFINVFDPVTLDPVTLGLVHAMDRPGTNCTGVVGFPPDMAGRWIATLKALIPALTRIGLLFHPGTAATMMPSHRAAAARAAAEHGIELFEAPLPDIASLDNVLDPVAAQPGTGLVVIPSTFMPTHRDAVVSALNRHRIPALYGISPMVQAGGLASFGPDIAAQWRLAASHVDALLRGADTRTLPVRVAPKTVLTLNPGTAALLGLELPARLRYQANIVT